MSRERAKPYGENNRVPFSLERAESRVIIGRRQDRQDAENHEILCRSELVLPITFISITTSSCRDNTSNEYVVGQ